jgi:hypothetical protein
MTDVIVIAKVVTEILDKIKAGSHGVGADG